MQKKKINYNTNNNKLMGFFHCTLSEKDFSSGGQMKRQNDCK